MLQTNVKK